MFNHSSQDQNVVWERDLLRQTITYRALRDIQAGEELCKTDQELDQHLCC
jgi:SET domain-containing protein